MFSEVSGFDWDDAITSKAQSHGVTIEEIEGFFRASIHVFPDIAHSNIERRYVAVGQGSSRRHLFVAFTVRAHGSERLIRPISARYMHEREVTHYEAQIAIAPK